MRYSEIFKEIVDITHNDYAGWDEKKGWDQPEIYVEKIDKMNKNGEYESSNLCRFGKKITLMISKIRICSFDWMERKLKEKTCHAASKYVDTMMLCM